jgi:hypothetical protein
MLLLSLSAREDGVGSYSNRFYQPVREGLVTTMDHDGDNGQSFVGLPRPNLLVPNRPKRDDPSDSGSPCCFGLAHDLATAGLA